MSFGWSAGDIAECVKLLIKIGKALKDSGGSIAEYQNAVGFLKGVETTVQGVENIIQNNPDLAFQDAFQEHAKNLMTALTHFKKKTEGYDASLGANARTSEAKKTWKKIKLALFGHIEELKSAVLYPQRVVNYLVGLQALDILVNLSKEPTLSPQQFQNFPVLENRIKDFRSGVAADFITIQQITESKMQSHLNHIQQNLSDGNTLQKSISAKVQADAEAQEVWRDKLQISITEIRAEAQKNFEEMKQAQETNHEHGMRAALWRNAPRPIFKVIRRTVIARSPLTRSVRQAVVGSRGGGSQGGNSKRGNSKGASPQGGVSRGKPSRAVSRQGGAPQRGNARGVKISGRNSSGATQSRAGISKGSTNSRGDSARAGSSKTDSSKGGKCRRNNSPRGSSENRNIRGGGSMRGSGSIRGGSKIQGPCIRGGNHVRDSNVRGGNVRGTSGIRGGNVRGSRAPGTSVQGISGVREGNRRGSSNAQGASVRGGRGRGGSNKDASVRGGHNNPGSNARGSSSRGGSARGGSSRGINVQGNSVRGGGTRRGMRGGIRGINVQGDKHKG